MEAEEDAALAWHDYQSSVDACVSTSVHLPPFSISDQNSPLPDHLGSDVAAPLHHDALPVELLPLQSTCIAHTPGPIPSRGSRFRLVQLADEAYDEDPDDAAAATPAPVTPMSPVLPDSLPARTGPQEGTTYCNRDRDLTFFAS
eukprot:jgi/Tetstr1/457530/TSEL_044110.t1